MYEAALKDSGCVTEFTYEKLLTKKKRNRKALWFNPPFSKNVKTNVGTLFLRLVRKHFIREHKFFKISNKKL